MKTVSALTILLLTFGLVPAQDSPSKAQPRFRVSVNMVLVNASVTSAAGRQGELRAEDFEVFEDGVKQEVQFFRSAEAPFHVALLIDSSGSTAAKLDLIRKAADRFLGKLAPDDRVAVIDVAGRVTVVQPFTKDRRLLSHQLHRIGTTEENGTLLRDALLTILGNVFQGVEGRKAVVFLSDGQDAGSKSRVEELKQAVYLSDAVLYGLLVDTERDLLKGMQEAEARFSRIALVIDASSSLPVKDVKQAALSLVDLLPPSAPVCLVQHRARRRAALLLPYTTDRTKLKDAINKASAEPSTTDMVSTWMASRGMTILITDSELDLPQRIQDDIRNQAAIFVLGKRPPKEWQEQLKDFARNVPDASALKRAMRELPVKYRNARQAVTDLCDHSGGRSFDLVSMSDLDNFYQQVADELRRTYSLGYYSHAAPGEYHRLDVKLLGGGQANVRARRGFVLQ